MLLCVLVDDAQHRELCAVAQAGKLCQCILGLGRQAANFLTMRSTTLSVYPLARIRFRSQDHRLST